MEDKLAAPSSNPSDVDATHSPTEAKVPSSGSINRGELPPLNIKQLFNFIGIGIVVGIIPSALLVASYMKATYYMSVCWSKETNEEANQLTQPGFSVACIELTRQTYHFCNLRSRILERFEDSEETDNPTCPPAPLVESMVYIVAIFWFGSILVWIVMPFIYRHSETTAKAVSIGVPILVAFVFLIICLSLFIFFLELIGSKYWCPDASKQVSQVDPTQFYSLYNLNLKGKTVPLPGMNGSLVNLNGDEICSDYNVTTFQPWLLLASAIFCVFTSVAYLFTSVVVLRANKVEHHVGPAPLH